MPRPRDPSPPISAGTLTLLSHARRTRYRSCRSGKDWLLFPLSASLRARGAWRGGDGRLVRVAGCLFPVGYGRVRCVSDWKWYIERGILKVGSGGGGRMIVFASGEVRRRGLRWTEG